jgi:type II secretory pathway pseudopilin PulG
MIGRKLREQGDTIVEVLIVIAIISLVLGGAYASARRSFITTQQTQERGEAIKFTEQQLELLKVASDDPDSGLFGAAGSTSFCLSPAGAVTPPCTVGIGGRYAITIDRTNTLVDGQQHYTFRARTSWLRAGGVGNEEITMFYRVHPIQ